MAQTIEAVLGNAEMRETLRKQGVLRAAQFSWRRTASVILEILKEAAIR
jgi:hypothetical protein